mgnify:CR=1 FL=1
MVLFVIDYATRKVEIAGIVPQADGKIVLEQQLGGLLKSYRRAA